MYFLKQALFSIVLFVVTVCAIAVSFFYPDDDDNDWPGGAPAYV